MCVAQASDASFFAWKTKASNSICMLWAMWTGVAVMPFTWIPPYNSSLSDNRSYDWEVSSTLRRRLLGPSASTLVTAYQVRRLFACEVGAHALSYCQYPMQAYLILPNRVAGCMHPVPDTMMEDLYDWEAVENAHDGSEASSSSLSSSSSSSTAHHPSFHAFAGFAIDRPVAAAGNSNNNPLLDVPEYYSSRHFLRVGSHAYQAWDDCMWLLMLQEPDIPPSSLGHAASAEPAGSSAPSTVRNVVDFILQLGDGSTEEGGRSTCFRLFEKELLLMKPFLMFCGVYAGLMGMNNRSYLEEENNDLVKEFAQLSGFRAVIPPGGGYDMSSSTPPVHKRARV